MKTNKGSEHVWRYLWLTAVLLTGLWLHAQEEEVYEDETVKRNHKVYYEGRPLTGWLVSTKTAPNKCECVFKIHYKNGKKHGLAQEWHSNGRLKHTGKYVNGYPVGTHKYYYPNGKLRRVEKYARGGIVHKIYYDKRGQKTRYEKWKNSKKLLSLECEPGIKDCIAWARGTEENTAESAPPQTNEITQTPEPDNRIIILPSDTSEADLPPLQSGIRKILYPDQTPKAVILYENGMPVMDSVFTRNGRLEQVSFYDNGKVVHEIRFDENLRKREEHFYHNDTIHGPQKYYEENGILTRIEIYEKGKKIKIVEYYPDGISIRKETPMDGELPHGEEKIYDSSGNVTATVQYKHGKKIRKNEYEKGILRSTRLYNAQGKSQELIYYYPDGKKKKQILYDNNGRQRRITDFDQDGLPVRALIFRDSLRIKIAYDGAGRKLTEEAYDQNDRLRYVGKYRSGQKEGTWNYYYPEKGYKIKRIYRADSLQDEIYVYLKRLIKNLPLSESAKIAKHTTRILGDNPHYQRLEYKFPEKPLQKFNIDYEIKERLDEIFMRPEQGVELITDTTGMGDEMVYGKVTVDSIDYRFYPQSKKPSNKRYKLALRFILKCARYQGNRPVTVYSKQYIFPPSIGSVDFMSKDGITEKILESVNIDDDLFRYCFPKKGSILKVHDQNSMRIRSVMTSLNKHYINKTKNFYVYDPDNPDYYARMTLSASGHQSYLRVEEGGEWLKKFLETRNPHPPVTSEPPDLVQKLKKIFKTIIP